MESALYEGWVEHRRLRPVQHGFRRRLSLCLLDLDELPTLFADTRLAAVEAWAPLCFRRRDFFGDPGVPLAEAVRDEVGRRCGTRPEGPVRLLTSLRTFGLCFNPVSLYYCYAPDGVRIDAVLADVQNTPWNERYAYVLPREAGWDAGGALGFDTDKEFHVSPFMPMEQRYRWRLSPPGERLEAGIANRDEEGTLFHAALRLERRPLCRAGLARVLVRQPLLPLRTLAGIYWHALRLHLKGAPFHPHPERAALPEEMQYS